MKAMALVDVPPCFATPGFMAERNAWYRRLEGEGHEIDELGYKQSRERAKKGPCRGDPMRYGISGEPDIAPVERVNMDRMGGRNVWSLETAEYWQLLSGEVEKLPDNYKAKRFLRRWTEIGEVTTAADDVGISRWRGRCARDRFLLMLKRKRVIR